MLQLLQKNVVSPPPIEGLNILFSKDQRTNAMNKKTLEKT
jgi:hypothetical protein